MFFGPVEEIDEDDKYLFSEEEPGTFNAPNFIKAPKDFVVDDPIGDSVMRAPPPLPKVAQVQDVPPMEQQQRPASNNSEPNPKLNPVGRGGSQRFEAKPEKMQGPEKCRV